MIFYFIIIKDEGKYSTTGSIALFGSFIRENNFYTLDKIIMMNKFNEYSLPIGKQIIFKYFLLNLHFVNRGIFKKYGYLKSKDIAYKYMIETLLYLFFHTYMY